MDAGRQFAVLRLQILGQNPVLDLGQSLEFRQPPFFEQAPDEGPPGRSLDAG